MSRIVVFGGSGFIGRYVVGRLLREGHDVLVVGRRQRLEFGAKAAFLPVSSYLVAQELRQAVTGASGVIYLAGRAHQPVGSAGEQEACWQANFAAPLLAAEQASQAGVRRFVYLSSIGVSGFRTTAAPFTADSPYRPHNPYTQAKAAAEVALTRLAERASMSVVSVRPPLVYGFDAPGNFASLLRWCASGLPVVVSTPPALRSYIGVDNLAEFLSRVSVWSGALPPVLTVADEGAASLTEAARWIAEGMGRRSLQVALPERLLWLGASLGGRRRLAERVLSPLVVDSSLAHRVLDWRPGCSLDVGLRQAGRLYREVRSHAPIGAS